MPQQRRHGLRPLVLEALRQLRALFRLRLVVLASFWTRPPHLGLVGLGHGVQGDQPVVADLGQAQPGHVPAAVGQRIGYDALVSVCQNVAAERVAGREPAQLGQELVAVDVVEPGGGHGLLKGASVGLILAGGGDLLDAAQLSQGVDAVGDEGVDELLE